MTEEKTPQKANRGRSLSRQILGSDLDLVNKYATKYNSSKPKGAALKRNQTYSSVPVCYNYPCTLVVYLFIYCIMYK